jgi:hypothetical protein
VIIIIIIVVILLIIITIIIIIFIFIIIIIIMNILIVILIVKSARTELISPTTPEKNNCECELEFKPPRGTLCSSACGAQGPTPEVLKASSLLKGGSRLHDLWV